MDDLIRRSTAINAVERKDWILEAMDSVQDGEMNRTKRAIARILAGLPSAHPELDEWCTDCKEYDHERHCCPRYNMVIRETLAEIREAQSTEPEITDKQAIEHLQSTGWMQNHDREMYDMGLKKQLADDSGSYDSLLPSAQQEQRWIPTSEKLPDELAEVNVTWENTEPEPYYDFVKGHCFTGTAVYFRGRWYWYSAVCFDYLREYGFSPNDEMDDAIKVLAWMPLPEPYREENR